MSLRVCHMVSNIHGQYWSALPNFAFQHELYVDISYSRFSSVNIVLFLSWLLLLVIFGFTRVNLLYFLVGLWNIAFTQLNLVNVSVSSENLCSPRFNSVKLSVISWVYFSVNSSVIFTRLILGLCSLKIN